MQPGEPFPRVPLPIAQWAERLKWRDGPRDVRASIDSVEVSPTVIEDFRPLHQCLAWRVSEYHWSRAGVLPFVENEVPFLVTNSGLLSENAARVLFANCAETQPDTVAVMELGAGTGLFARYFLDSFRALCEQEQQTYYDRLTYVVTDGSAATIAHWRERQLFAGHSERVVMEVCNAARPFTDRADPLRAVFCNYVLDVLPAAIVRRGRDGAPEQLCLRTHVNNDPGLRKLYSSPPLDEVRRLAESTDPQVLATLVPWLSLFDYELAFRADGTVDLPFIDDALDAKPELQRVRLNYGALDCLSRCLERLAPGGFILLNDYGQVRDDQPPDQSAAQRFGVTTAVGVNFPLLEHCLHSRGVRVRKPSGDDERTLHSRLITRDEAARTAETFENRFSAQAYRHAEEPLQQARGHNAAGRNGEALESYRAALRRNPRDWAVIGEAAEFVSVQLRDHTAAMEMCRAALDLNPVYSTWLWNVMGDALYCLERHEDAHEAYLQAERIDPNDVRTNLNLAYTFLQAGRFEDCLRVISRGFAADVGLFRDRLLEKQQQVLGAINSRWLGERDRLAKRDQRFRSSQ